MAKQIAIDHVFKVFGNDPKTALNLVKQGLDKQEILARTGQSIGVFDADFTIEAGEIFVVMGLSGSGKSTLVRMLNRLIEPTSGRILVDGQDINALSDKELRALRRKDISMVFQSFALMPHLTVLDNTAFGLELAGVDRATRQQQAQDALEQVGLGAWGASYPDELSGGMQQRVGLARALASDPSILLMDEAMRIGDRIAIMKDGVVQQVGTPDDILRNPANEYVRTFIQGVDAAAVFKASDIARQALTVISEHSDRGCRAALRLLEDSDRDHAYVLNARKRFLGVVSSQSLRDALQGHEGMLGLKHAFIPDVQPIASNTPVADLFGAVASPPFALPVVDEDGKYLGVISRTTMLKFLDRATPPVPPPQKEIPPIKLNPHFQPGAQGAASATPTAAP